MTCKVNGCGQETSGSVELLEVQKRFFLFFVEKTVIDVELCEKHEAEVFNLITRLVSH